MSVVAVKRTKDKIEMVADSFLGTSTTLASNEYVKIHEHKGCVYGTVGTCLWGELFHEFITSSDMVEFYLYKSRFEYRNMLDLYNEFIKNYYLKYFSHTEDKPDHTGTTLFVLGKNVYMFSFEYCVNIDYSFCSIGAGWRETLAHRDTNIVEACYLATRDNNFICSPIHYMSKNLKTGAITSEVYTEEQLKNKEY